MINILSFHIIRISLSNIKISLLIWNAFIYHWPLAFQTGCCDTFLTFNLVNWSPEQDPTVCITHKKLGLCYPERTWNHIELTNRCKHASFKGNVVALKSNWPWKHIRIKHQKAGNSGSKPSNNQIRHPCYSVFPW